MSIAPVSGVGATAAPLGQSAPAVPDQAASAPETTASAAPSLAAPTPARAQASPADPSGRPAADPAARKEVQREAQQEAVDSQAVADTNRYMQQLLAAQMIGGAPAAHAPQKVEPKTLAALVAYLEGRAAGAHRAPEPTRNLDLAF